MVSLLSQHDDGQVDQAVELALELVETEQDDRPMRQTLCFVDAAQLFQAHGIQVDEQRVRRAAQYCLTYGSGDQAQELLPIPGIHTWLTEETLQSLAKLIQS
jgi:hypothetical protein